MTTVGILLTDEERVALRNLLRHLREFSDPRDGAALGLWIEVLTLDSERGTLAARAAATPPPQAA